MNKINAVSSMILESKRVVVFTGAGICRESGVPDFSSPGEIWDRFDPSEFTYTKFLKSEANREKFWRFFRALWAVVRLAKPNRGHLAIAELNNLDKLDCVITQNIDNLHQETGIPEDKVIELSGTLKWVKCLGCGKSYFWETIFHRLERGEKVPKCDPCGGILKPATVIFGQTMPEREICQARQKVATCDFLCIVGSSLIAYPAAQIPLIAKDNGARLVIINLTSTPHDPYADILIQGRIVSTLSRIVEQVKTRIGVSLVS